MTTIAKYLSALGLLAGPVVANAQATTYVAFKGVAIEDYPNGSVVLGTPVTGIYTFGPATGVNFTGNWTGSGFSTTATAVGAYLSSSGSGAYSGSDAPNVQPVTATYRFQASACVPYYVYSSPGCGAFSTILLESADQPTWTQQGLPVIDPKGAEPQGSFGFLPPPEDLGYIWEVSYSITSLQVVPAPPIVVSLLASATTVTQGNPFLLTWSSTGTESPNGTIGSCAASGGGASGSPWTGALADVDQISEPTKVAGTFTYTVTCTVGNASAKDSVTVTVKAPASTSSSAPTSSSGGGGGGGMSDLELALLAALRWVCRSA